MTKGTAYLTPSRGSRRTAFVPRLLLTALAGIIASFATIFIHPADAAPLSPEQREQLSRSNAQAVGRRGSAALLAPTRAYNWSGLYGGVFAGVGAVSGNNLNVSAATDPVAQGNGVGFGAPAGGGYSIFSQAYNDGANGNGLPGSVTPAAQDYRCNVAGRTPSNGCNNLGPPFGPTTAATTNVPFANAGTRTDATFPTSMGMQQQVAALIGLEMGYRWQFNSPLVLGVGSDISLFGNRGDDTTFSSQGAFQNSRGANATASALACFSGQVTSNGGNPPFVACQGNGPGFQPVTALGNFTVTNTGNSAAVLMANTKMNWLGTVRGNVGYAFDRLLIFGSAGLAYGETSTAVRATYRDTVTSACTGVNQTNAGPAVVTPADPNGTGSTGNLVSQQGSASVNYNCNGVANGNVTRTTVDTINYAGNRSGVMAGFAIGGGVGYALTDNIALKTEGFYYNLGTVRTTVTGTGTQTTTTSGGAGAGTQTAALTATPFTVSRVIDGYIMKAGVEVKFSAF